MSRHRILREPGRPLTWNAPLRIVSSLRALRDRDHVPMSSVLEALVTLALRQLGEPVADVPGLMPPGAQRAAEAMVMSVWEKDAWRERAVKARRSFARRGIPIAELSRAAGCRYQYAHDTLTGKCVSPRLVEAAEEILRQAPPRRRIWRRRNGIGAEQ